jgi:hypothetical protein
MAFLRDLRRQANQNKNDVEDLYKLSDETNKKVKEIAEVQQKHGLRLNAIDGRLEVQDGKLDEILGILKAP